MKTFFGLIERNKFYGFISMGDFDLCFAKQGQIFERKEIFFKPKKGFFNFFLKSNQGKHQYRSNPKYLLVFLFK